jgi:enoyl-CoA hydratase/carnithine racemase
MVSYAHGRRWRRVSDENRVGEGGPAVSEVTIEDVGAVRVITLNRPAARNALGGDLITELHAALLGVDDDPGVRAAVLTGADPAFCAGVDLKQAAAEGEAYFRRLAGTDVVNQTGRVRKPLIGAINGATFTGGLELALGCDFLIASERAVFADTHARVGVLPAGGMTARLPYLVGPAWARRMSMCNEVIPADLALRIGLVTEVVAHERLLARAVELATAAAEPDGATMVALKDVYGTGAATVLGAALAAEQDLAAAFQPDYAGLDARRRAVLARNRAQLR